MLPLAIDLQGARVLVVGAGPVAAGKVERLLDAGAQVTVVAPEAVGSITAHAEAGALTWHQRRYAASDLAGVLLVVAATAEAEVNAHVAADAADRPVLCVRADGGGTAAFVAAVERGPLTITVSTGGAAPALAKRLRVEIAQAYGPEYGQLASLLGELRADPWVAAALAGLDDEQRAARWRSVLDVDILSHIRSGRIDLAREVALSCLSSSSG